MSTHEPSDFSASIGEQLASFIDEHRSGLTVCLDGLSEAEARQRLVPSKTTLLGLVKHATFVERVWFDEAVTCRPRSEIGIPLDPDESFDLTEADTIASVRTAYVQACVASRKAVEHLGVDDIVNGNRRGPLPMRWVYLHVLRELAQHCGHADILREQVLASRPR
ncbi:DinB family protein [Nocardioides sp. Iso805N]|uniref:DinB family protein n=1 Tax=Nocardioides sp. Iso805N TaxID=1283287 RepID=UPI000367EA28|nr:DinB family protein [Nocardioides sp. Iso805N]